MTILSEKQIEWHVRSHLRAAHTQRKIVEVRSARLLEKNESNVNLDAIKQALQKWANIADTAVDKIKTVESNGSKDLEESVAATIYGGFISAGGIAKLLGYMAKGIAKVLKSLGANVDPEKEGKTFFDISHSIHHFYIGTLKKLAAKMHVKEEKQKLVANIMFGVLLGAAASMTGVELYNAYLHNKSLVIAGEGIMSGIKAAEGVEIGTDLFAIFSEAAETVENAVDLIDIADDVVG